MFQLVNSVEPREATSSHIEPRRATAIYKVAVDAGNRFTKIATSAGNTHQMPSYFAEANFRDTTSIHYESGDRLDLVGKRWHIGEAAKNRNGEPVFLSEKSDLMPMMVLGSLPSIGAGTIAISALRLCVPDVWAVDTDKVSSALKGCHQINGSTYKISGVSVHSEAICSYPFLMEMGAFKYARPNGIVDIGGGNTTGVIISPSGEPIWESKFTGHGTIELAKMVAYHPALVGLESKGVSPRLDLILDAIAGDGFYGSQRSISQAINDCLPGFLTKIKKQINTAWEPYLSTLGEIAVIGGSAALCADWAAKNSRIKLIENSQFANAQGLLCV